MEQWPFPPNESPFHVKGLVYRTFGELIDTQVGRSRFMGAIKEPALRDFISQPFLAASWYDLGPLIELNAITAELLHYTLTELYRVRSLAQAQQDLGGIYSFVLKVLSPLAVARTLPRLTARYFDWGGVEIHERGPREVDAVRTGVPMYFAEWYTHVAGEYMRFAINKAGAKALDIKPVIKTRAREHNVAMCDICFQLKWR
jgi:hypothetical protein